MASELIPMLIWRDDGVVCTMLLCFLLTLLIYGMSKRYLPRRIKSFFYPGKSHKPAEPSVMEDVKRVTPLLYLQVSLLVGVLFYGYARDAFQLSRTAFISMAHIGIFAVVSLLMLLFKNGLYGLVHNVFFPAPQRQLWAEHISLINLVESLLLFVLTVLAVFMPFSPMVTLYSLVITLLLVKIFLLFKAFTTFFKKKHGVLHIFVYFCALEAVPLVVLWATLMVTANRLIPLL